MTMFWETLLLALAASSVVVAGRKFPDFFKVCSRNNSDLNGCITDSLKGLSAQLAVGVPDLNLPSIEPLFLGDLTAIEVAGFHLVAKRFIVRGISHFELSAMNVNPSESVSFHVKFPRLHAEAYYEIAGRLILIPLFSNGPFSGELTNVNGDVNLKFRVVNDKIEIESLSVTAKVGGGRVELGGDSMPDAVNNIINSNFDKIVLTIMPAVESALNRKILDIAGKIVEEYSYDDLFPPGK